jgi:hypothetical protein
MFLKSILKLSRYREKEVLDYLKSKPSESLDISALEMIFYGLLFDL